MPLTVEGENYYTASEAAKYLQISRETFYENVKDQLQPYKHGALKRIYYREAELDKFRNLRPTLRERKESQE